MICKVLTNVECVTGVRVCWEGRGVILFEWLFQFGCNMPLSQYIHYNDVILTTMASEITSLTDVNSTAYSDAYQRKHQSSVSLAFVWGIHRDRWIPRTKGQSHMILLPLLKVTFTYAHRREDQDWDLQICILSLPYSKVHGAHMGPIWGRQVTGGPTVGPMNFAILVTIYITVLDTHIESWNKNR